MLRLSALALLATAVVVNAFTPPAAKQPPAVHRSTAMLRRTAMSSLHAKPSGTSDLLMAPPDARGDAAASPAAAAGERRPDNDGDAELLTTFEEDTSSVALPLLMGLGCLFLASPAFALDIPLDIPATNEYWFTALGRDWTPSLVTKAGVLAILIIYPAQSIIELTYYFIRGVYWKITGTGPPPRDGDGPPAQATREKEPQKELTRE